MVDRDNNKSATGADPSRYAVIRQIGEGGMGEVYLARDGMLDRKVALKMLPATLEADAVARQRFLREAKSAAALDHPYICKIYEIGELDGRPFIAMEHVDGRTLAGHIDDGALSAEETVRLTIEIVEALETAHAAGIVHRDLKPANVMITASGHAKVMDFGLAKRVRSPAGRETRFETASRLTGTGMLLGTPAYMSPEQLRGEELDSRSDTFSLGVLLYEMLTGVHPFTGASAMDTIAAILGKEPAPLTRHHEAPAGLLEHVVARMTAKSPTERYQHIREARIDLARVYKSLEGSSVAQSAADAAGLPAVDGSAPSRAPVPPPTEATPIPATGRWPRFPAGAAAVSLVAVVALGAWWMASRPPRAEPDIESGAAAVPVADPSRQLAVLPFRSLRGAPSEEVLAQGLPGSIATRLINIGVTVTPSDSVRIAHGDGTRPAADVARDLGADLALTGELQLFDQARIVARLELIDAAAGTVSWSQPFESSVDDLFEMTTAIAIAAAEALEIELTGEAREILATAETTDLDALEYYYRGARMLRMAASPEEMDAAVLYFEEALSVDPGLAEAHLGIGATRVAQFWEGGGSTAELIGAQGSYERARDLAPSSPIAMKARRALIVLYFIIGHRDYPERILREWQDAQRYADPNDVESLLTFALVVNFALQDFEAAAELLSRVLEIDRLNPEAAYWAVHAAWPFSPALADRHAEQLRQLQGETIEPRIYQAFAHHRSGDLAGAIEIYDAALRLTANDTLFAAPDAARSELFVFAGIAYEQAGLQEEAVDVWQTGLRAVTEQLRGSFANYRLSVEAATLYGVLGETDEMETAERIGLEGNFAAYEVAILAAMHARRGELDHAIELIEQTRMLPAFFPQFYRMATGKELTEEPRLRVLFADADERIEAIMAEFSIDYGFGRPR